MTVLFPHSSAPLKRVQQVQFGLFSPEETKRMSICRIEFPETYENGRPKHNGLLDPRMGTVDRNQKCLTCQENMGDCPGHFAHIELQKACFHIGYMPRIKKILECICHHCGKLKMDMDNPRFAKTQLIKSPQLRFRAVWELCKGKNICEGSLDPGTDFDASLPPEQRLKKKGGCGSRQPSLRKEGLKFIATYKQNQAEEGEPTKIVYTAQKVYQLFKRISSDDCIKMGLDPIFARPDWLLITVLPVPPPAVRPSIQVDGTSRGEDDLTYKLADILKANLNLKKHETEGSPAHVVAEFEALLQYHIVTYMNNDISGLPQAMQKNGRPLKSIRARLKGKEGRLRGNLMGKRVDFSARTVITGDPNLSLDQVGVPRSIARILTFPEMVTDFNMQQMQQLIRNGPNEHPGARYVIRENGDRIDLSRNTRGAEIHLNKGDVVERHIRDGDIVLFNRQPSLHKMSMMGHRVKVMPYSTFRLNLSVTTPYNADFDGDEMNMHIPQSYESRAEISEICMVPKQIVSPQSNRPVMGIVQDTLCGIRKFTKRDCFLDRHSVMQLCMWIRGWDGQLPEPSILYPVPLWTGKQILSMIIPRGTNLIGFHSTHPDKEDTDISPGDTKVLIHDGLLLCGIVCKKTVGTSQNSLIHIIWKEHGPEKTRDFFDGCQVIVNNWLLQNGFSIGIGDTIADTETMQQITNTIAVAKQRVKEIILQAQQNQLQCLPGMTIRESFESNVNQELNRARDVSGASAQKSLSEWNNVKQMVVAGSKGSFINISQMTACVGQQNVEGKRIPFGFKYRTLPHFTKDDYSPESKGFVENSYLRGLTPQEFFFHAMGGREGLIDTAVKTAETGYIQRRLVKALEDVMVNYDGTVRNAMGHVLQFAYGEDGMDGVCMERQVLDSLRLSDELFKKKYLIDVTDPKYSLSSTLLQPEVYQSLLTDPKIQQQLDQEFIQLSQDRLLLRQLFKKGDSQWPLPFHVKRLIWNAQTIFQSGRNKQSDLHPLHIIDSVRLLCERLSILKGSDPITQQIQDNASLLFRILIRSTLSTRRVLEEYHLNQLQFDWIVGEIENRFQLSLVHPGEMVGTLAAQSIGEPATQMTLNTFHYAGVSSKNVTLGMLLLVLILGVPRLKEIINVAKKNKTPSTTIYLKGEYSKEMHKAKQVQVQIEYTTLKNVCERTEIWYDPDVEQTVVAEDVDTVFAYYSLMIGEDYQRYSPWVLRIVLDRRMLLDKEIKPQLIVGRLKEEFRGDMDIFASDENAQVPVIRCRIIRSEEEGDEMGDEEDIFLRRLEGHILNQINLRGIPDIQRVFMVEKKNVLINPRGEYEQTSEWVLETDGINLKNILTVEHVDPTRTYSNSVLEIMEVLGVEAARTALLKELRNVIEFDGSYVNYRHLCMLCDVMTQKGYLMAITRHGINRTDSSPLMRCSFEETVEILLEAAAVGETDYCEGVAENILLGQLAPLGTGKFDLLLDEQQLSQVSIPMMTLEQGRVTPAGMTPYVRHDLTPQYQQYPSPAGSFYDAVFSPQIDSGKGLGGGGISFSPSYAPKGGLSPGYSPTSPGYSPTSPGYSPSSPGYSPTSPNYSPTSPGYSPTSPNYSPTSPAYSPTSPAYSPTSPAYSPTSPQYSPTSPQYSPTSPQYSPTSPQYSPTSPQYSPTSPQYSPTSPQYSPTSPQYSPTSPQYSPTSPQYSPTSPQYSPTSPQYSPTSPQYSPTSPQYSPTSPQYSPTSPQYSPTSPQYSPTSPQYSPTSPQYSTTSPQYNATSPQYSPISPQYSSTSPQYSSTSPQYSPNSPNPNTSSATGNQVNGHGQQQQSQQQQKDKKKK